MQNPSDDQVAVGGRRLKTRERILEAARKLFNERGEGNVTFADIGERVGISEGNVWYHFHTKHDLIFALFTELQMRVRENQERDLDDLRQARHIEDLLARGFHLMWEYRFLYRDHSNWTVAEREVHAQLVALALRGHAFIEQVLERLCQLELLHVSQGEAGILATNIWIVSRYWIDYCQARSGPRQIQQDFSLSRNAGMHFRLDADDFAFLDQAIKGRA